MDETKETPIFTPVKRTAQFVKTLIWIASAVSVLIVIMGSVAMGTKMEKDACLVRAYENRIDVDLGKKICAYPGSAVIIAAQEHTPPVSK
jgi:hypothetical protein